MLIEAVENGYVRVAEIESLLRARNLEHNPVFMRELEVVPPAPLLLVVSDAERRVLGGLIAGSRGRWLKVDVMAVQRALRRRGTGRALLRAAEVEARQRGCDRVYVETMSHQAPAFYEACGYALRCTLDDWDSHGHAKHIYVRELA